MLANMSDSILLSHQCETSSAVLLSDKCSFVLQFAIVIKNYLERYLYVFNNKERQRTCVLTVKNLLQSLVLAVISKYYVKQFFMIFS